MQVYFIHDFLRAEWDGGTAERSGRWLNASLAPALRRLGHRTRRLGLADPTVQSSLARALNTQHGGNALRWPTLFSDPAAVPLHAAMLSHLSQASLVIGFELAPNQMRVLHAAGIPFVDVAIDPIRFASDLFLALRTNDPGLAHAFASCAAPTANMTHQARHLGIRAPAAPPQNFLFVGQTDIDAALIMDARLGTVEPHLPVLRGRFGDGEKLLLKPHPYGRAHQDVLILHRTFPHARIVDDNVYALLGSGIVAEVVTLSSGVAVEAPFFGVAATTLLKPDTQHVDVVSPRIRLSPQALCLDLWAAATSTVAIAGRPRRKVSLRSQLGLAWAFPPPSHFLCRHIAPGDIFNFGSRGHSTLRGFGWSHPETTGCWTDGLLATLLVDPAGQPLDLFLHCRAYLAPGTAPLQVTLEVRGAPVPPKRLSFYWPRPRTIKVSLPPVNGLVEIALHISNPRSPASTGSSNDHRALGLHVTKACIQPRFAVASWLPPAARAMAASVAAALLGG